MAHSPDELEKQVHRILRSLPERTAPATLEARVLARIGSAGLQPWWRRSYAGWPLSLRLAFLIGSAAAAAIVAVAFSRLAAAAPLVDAAGVGSQLMATTRALGSDLAAVSSTLIRLIPTTWAYGLLGTIVAAYAILIGLGSALYRTVTRSSLSP